MKDDEAIKKAESDLDPPINEYIEALYDVFNEGKISKDTLETLIRQELQELKDTRG